LFFGGAQDFQILVKRRAKHIQEVLVNQNQPLDAHILKTDGARLKHAGDIVLLHVEVHNLDEFEHFRVELLVVNLEMPRLDRHNTCDIVSRELYLEELLHDVVSVFEVWVFELKFQLNEDIVVFIVR